MTRHTRTTRAPSRQSSAPIAISQNTPGCELFGVTARTMLPCATNAEAATGWTAIAGVAGTTVWASRAGGAACARSYATTVGTCAGATMTTTDSDDGDAPALAGIAPHSTTPVNPAAMFQAHSRTARPVLSQQQPIPQRGPHPSATRATLTLPEGAGAELARMNGFPTFLRT